MANPLHVTERERAHDHEFFQRLRDVASRNGFTVPERSWSSIARLVRQRLGKGYARFDDHALVAALQGVRGTHSGLFALAPALFGNLDPAN